MSFNDFLNEKRKVTLKRRYTENHPAVEVGLTAKVRNKMIEAVADGRLTQEEFKTILSELSTDTGRWMRRNAKYFNVSEDGVSLSTFGRRLLKTVIITENEHVILESTRSHVGIIDKNGKINSTYVHSDGYPEGVGATVVNHFADTRKVKELLKLGKWGISYLEPGIEGGKGHSFNTPVDGETVFYGRDRGQKKFVALVTADQRDLQDYLNDLAYDGAEYVYLWDEAAKKWMYAETKTSAGRKKGLQVLENVETIGDELLEGRNAFVTAARVAKSKGLKEFEFKGNTFPVTVKDINEEEVEEPTEDVVETKLVAESFSDFVSKLDEEQVNEWGSSDTSIMNKEIHKQAGSPKTMPSPFDKKLRNAAEDAVDFYWSDWEEYQSDRDGLIDDAVRSYLRQYFGEQFKLLQRMFEGSEVNETRFYAIFQGTKHEIEAKDLYDAKKKAIADLKIKKKDQGLLSIVNADQHDKGVFVESVSVNEAFKSSKLQQLFNTNAASTWGQRPIKDLPKAFYNMANVALDKVEDGDLIDMADPKEAHALDKAGKGRYVIFYIVDQDKENPYAPEDGYKTIPPGIIAIVKNNNFQGVEWTRSYGGTGKRALTSADDGGVGVSKKYKGWDGTGLYNPKRIADVADRAVMLDVSALQDKYSTQGKRADRAAAQKGAIAFKSDKDFRAENIKRYKEILADKAANLPLDKMVKDAIDMLSAQIKSGLESGETNNGELILGLNPKGRPVRMRDASNHMSNILDNYANYVRYSNEAKDSISDYYAEQVKKEAKSIKDRIDKIATMNYVW